MRRRDRFSGDPRLWVVQERLRQATDDRLPELWALGRLIRWAASVMLLPLRLLLSAWGRRKRSERLRDFLHGDLDRL